MTVQSWSPSGNYTDALNVFSFSEDPIQNWALNVCAYGGRAGNFQKRIDDDYYAVSIWGWTSTSEGLYVQGNTVATGTKSAAIETSTGPQAIFSVESPEVEIYASGSARLNAGKFHVEFDQLFTEAVSTDVEIRVTVTPVGGWSGLYVESTSPQGFTILSGAGDQNVRFHWMACGRRAGYETRPYITIPDPAEEQAVREIKERAIAEKRALAEEQALAE